MKYRYRMLRYRILARRMLRRRIALKDIPALLHDHYHWIIVGVVFLMCFVHGGTLNNITSLHIIPVSEHLGISRAEFSLAFSAKTVTSMLGTFVSGFLLSKLGCRLAATLGLALCSGAFLMFANVESVWMLSLAGGLLGLSIGFCSTAAAVHISRAWFHRYTGTVFGIISAATGIGGSTMCILQTAAMEKGSFRSSFLVCAVAVTIAAVLVAVLVRNHPKDKGLVPVGEGEEFTEKRKKGLAIPCAGLPMRTLWTRPAFYLMMLWVLLTCFCVYMAFSVIRPFLVDCGFSTTTASGFQSAMLLLLTLTKVLTGFFSDRFGAKKTIFSCIGLGVIGFILLACVRNTFIAGAAIVLYSCILPMATVATPLIASTLFGYRAQTTYTGILLGITNCSLFLGEYTTNWLHDLFGSYRPAFLIAAAIAFLCILLLLLLCVLAEKDLTRPDAQ